MSVEGGARRGRAEAMTERARVTPLELFFDLVFVYAFTQVTAIMAGDLTARGMLHGLLMLAVLWWVWCCYAWVGTTLRADEGVVRAVMLTVTVAMFIVALTIPEAFGDFPGGLRGPVVFATCYVIIRTLHVLIYWYGARYWVGAGDREMQRQVIRIAIPMLAASSILFVASFTTGVAQTLLWVGAIVIDYGGVLLAGTSGWVVPSPGHFAERFGLIIIIALGESVVSIGVGVVDLPISWPIVAASVLGMVVVIALWWLYFDVVAIAAEHRFTSATGRDRAAIARDSYTFLHLPMVAGIILLSLGLKKVLNYVGAHQLDEPLKGIGLISLYGGVVLYLLGHLGFRLRNLGSVNVPRVVTIVLLVVLLPFVGGIPAMGQLVLLAVVCAGLVGFEIWRYADARYRLRHTVHEGE